MKKILLIAMAMFLCGAAAAQEGPPPGMGHGPGMGPGPGMGGPPPPGMNEKDRERFGEKLRQKAEIMMLALLADEMELDEEKEVRFLSAVRTHLKESRAIDEKTRKIEEEIGERLNEKGGGKKDLEAKLNELEKLREDHKTARKNFEKKLAGFLSVEERARFVVAWPKAQQEVMERFEQMREMRKEMGGKKKHKMGFGGDENQPEGKPGKPMKDKK